MSTPDQFTYPLPSTFNPTNTSKTILLTGLNGYIASHIALLLLRKGYTVRGTSRSPSTLTKLLTQPAFAPYAVECPDRGRLQHVVVPDIVRRGAFDDAVRGVHAVIHTASPVDFTLDSVDAFFGPAVGGVLSILDSVERENKRGGSVVSFVQLSSIAAVVDRWRFPGVREGGAVNRDYTEGDWNESGEGVARASEGNGKGQGWLPMVAYGASKAAAERAMWHFVEEKRRRGGGWVGPACASVNPGVVTGPVVNWPERPEGLNETLAPVWNVWSGKCKREGRLPMQIGGASYVDVRDVAALHVWCIENPDASGGQRYLATNGKAPPQAIVDVILDVYGEEAGVRERIIEGEQGKGYVQEFGWPSDEPTVKATKAYKALGVERFRGFEESITDTIESFRKQWPELGF